MKSYGYTLFSVICYVILCVVFLGIFEKKRRELKKGYQYFILTGLILVNICVTELFTEQLLMKECLIAGVTACAMLFLFQGRRVRVFMLTLLYQSGSLIINNVIGSLLLKYAPVLLLPEVTASAAGSGSSLLCENVRFYLIIFLKLYLSEKSAKALKEMEQLRVWGAAAFHVIIILSCLERAIHGTGNTFWYIAIGLLLMNEILSELLNDILKRYAKLQKEQLVLNKVENETRLHQTILKSYERQKKREHEYKNQILCVTAMVQEEKYAELKEYLAEVDRNITNGMELFDTNHSMVNTILNLKYQEAGKRDILLVVKINDLSELPISDEDVVTILSNLLDNAMEACEFCEDKVIKLKFVKNADRIILSVRNTLAKPPQIMDGTFRSSKTERSEEHGVGIANICEIVEKYGGSYTITYDEKEFCFTILIFCRGTSITPPLLA